MLAVSISGADGFAVFVSEDGGVTAKEVARSTEHIRVAGRAGGYNRGGLSADGSLLCLQHAEYGDEMHEALRVIDPRTGATVADLVDDGKQLVSSAWSPIAGDRRLAVVHERSGIPQPAIWDPVTGEWTEIATDLEGEVSVADWWPDASALLLSQLHDGRYRLHRFELATGDADADRASRGPGRVGAGAAGRRRVVPAFERRLAPADPRRRRTGGAAARAASRRRPPARSSSMRFENRHGQSVQGFLVTPPGSGPWPILVRPHGGPSWLDEDKWHPEVQSYVDAGLAVLLLNYRGSTGRGAEWRDTLVGDIGGPELEDLNDALDRLIADGIADPERAVVGGWSWGGYLTLMMLGKHPERRWRCGIAGVPVGDYELSYEDLSPLLRAYDRALLGGRPDELPELMAERNPINSADAVEAPGAVPDRGARLPLSRTGRRWPTWTGSRRGSHPHEVYLFSTGHGSYDIEEEIRQQRTILGFLAEHVPGCHGPSGLSRYRGRVPTWIVVLLALLGGFVIWRVGIAMLRSLTLTSPSSDSDEPAPSEPEDVDDLDVYLVCGECGTELKVSRLGELQIPRHCGEKMQVIRRPAPA